MHLAREMMFGYRDEFEYVECANCGCVQIRESPIDIAHYYPDGYYSLNTFVLPPYSPVRNYLRTKWIDYKLTGKGMMGMCLNRIRAAPSFYKQLREHAISKESRILDVGCGNGVFLIYLQRTGFNNLLGIDSYLPNDIHYDNGVSLLKKRINDLDEKYDLITLNHSFEHMPDPFDVMQTLYRLLKPSGLLLIGTPVIGFAWRHYGINWIQLDAPRHFFLHSRKSMKMLSVQNGFEIAEIDYNSSALQFLGSELYCRDISLNDEKSWFVNPSASPFSKKEIVSFRKKAKELNKEKDGDMADFYLCKA